MKLINLKIKDFKNLTGPKGWFEIDFQNKNGITLLVGNNGSGKSNVLEAIAAIFSGLNKGSKKFDFEFELQFLVSSSSGDFGGGAFGEVVFGGGVAVDKKVNISYIEGIFQGNDNFKEVKIIANYSGEEERLFKNYFDYFEKQNKKMVRGKTRKDESTYDVSRLFFVDRRDWQKVILTLATYDLGFLKEKIGIKNIEDINIKFNIKELEVYIKSQNPTTAFIEKINNSKNSNKTYSLNFFINRFTDIVWGDLDEKWEDMNNQWADFSMNKKEFYENLFLAEQLGFIKDMEINFSKEENISSLSEGEKKQILIYFILNVLADKDSIILLDEPDSSMWEIKKD